MKKNQEGFSLFEALLALVIIFLIGFAGWLVWVSKGTEGTKTTSQTNTSKNTKVATITLIDKAANKPLANTSIELSSTNGAICPASFGTTCSNNPKKWSGNTDNKGVIKVDRGLIQKNNEILKKKTFSTGTEGYEPIAHFNASGVAEPNDPVSIELSK